MRAMKDSGIAWIGEIPEDWNVKRVKAVLCERNESNNPIQTDRILSLTNDRGVIPYEEKGDVGNKSKEDLTGYKLAYPGDIVLNSMNVFIGSVALSSYFGCVSPVYYMLYPRNKNDSVSFYNYLFQTKELQTKLHGYGNGIMEIRMRIQMSKLNSVQLPVPPSDVQQKIADYLDRKCSQIDAIIARQQEVIEKLKAYKMSVITEAVTKGLNPHAPMKDSGVEWIGEIPQCWSGKRLADLCDRGITYGIVKLGDEDESGTKVLRCSDVNPGYIDESNIRTVTSSLSKEYNRTILRGGEVVVNVRGTLGGCAIVPEHMRGYNIAREVAMVSVTKANPQFVMYNILSNAFQSYQQYSLRGVIYTGLNISLLSKYMLFLPSTDEQKCIVTFLNEKGAYIDRLIKKKQRLIDYLQDYKKSLIYEVVTGKKEV